jgi:hypothetical protein
MKCTSSQLFSFVRSLYLCGKIIFVYKYRIIENELHGVQRVGMQVLRGGADVGKQKN